jgi:DNA repair exonuclease SbcCD nuclease subunit
MLRILHTADLHLGLEFGQLDGDDRRKLARARLKVVGQILNVADQFAVDAVLWAGDIFDAPDVSADWWGGFAAALASRPGWTRPVILLPGNHDPIRPGSVFEKGHAFRAQLPPWVHVVDRDDFELAIGEHAVIYAAPCRSTAGAEDLALTLPARADGDQRIRIGLAHGSTFDLADHQTNFPIATDATTQRGLDYLAVGDTHGYREIPANATAPIVYPGAPEPTSFADAGAGDVAIVSFKRAGARPQMHRVKVAQWTWREETVTRLAQLRALAADDLIDTVLRLRVDLAVSAAEEKEVERLIALLKGTSATTGRAGALVVDRRQLRAQPPSLEELGELPETLTNVAARLSAEAQASAQGSDQARRALRLLAQYVSEAAQ